MLTFISYGMLRKESVNSRITSTSNNLLLVGRNLESYLDGIEQLSLPQISYDEITYAIMHESEDYASKMYVEDYLKNLYFSRNDLEAITLYVIKEQKYYYVTKENYNITIRVAQHPRLRISPGISVRWQARLTVLINPLCRTLWNRMTILSIPTKASWATTGCSVRSCPENRRRYCPCTSTPASPLRS